MTPIPLSDWDEVGDLVEHALDLAPADRDPYLIQACGADADRLARARRVLAAAEAAGAFLDTPAADVAAGLASDAHGDMDDDAAPATIGPYRVIRRLGRGGMGEVFLADRADDEFQRQVAIKVVRSGLGRDLVARFRHERQVLASLDHPHIARLFDGGMADDGRPYLVMEYVDGQPIDAYADAARQTVDQRLAIFLQVCDAVDRAHRRLIVHRDLKPANVVVSAQGVAKLLDFGVAKLLDADTSPGEAPLTRDGLRVMTPEYASPEQFLGEPTTTATDVYALGVMLYELLTGRRPHDAGRSGASLEKLVLHHDPVPPSVACRADAASGSAADRAVARRTTVDGLARQLRGDLDNIVLTALRREPERRYASVAALRADIERHRTGRPIAARPATVRYRAGKFVGRHRIGVAAAALVAAVVVIGTTSTIVQARAAAREGRRAEQIRDFLVGVFEVSDPDRSGGEVVTARALLDQGSARIQRELADDPVLRADMLAVLGRLYRQLGLFEDARRHMVEALSLRREMGAAPVPLVDSLTDLASVEIELGAEAEAEALLREALAIAAAAEGVGSATVASVTSDLAAVHRARGEFAEAEARAREAVAIRRAIGDPDGLGGALSGLGALLTQAGKPAEAVEALRESVTLLRAAHGDVHTKVALGECNLAQALHRQGELDEAVDTFRACIDHRRRLLGDGHPHVGLALNNLALVHSDRNEYAEAERLYSEALAIQRAAFGDHHRAVAGTLNNLAILAFQQQRYTDAAGRFRELVDVWRSLVGPDHPDTLTTTNNLGMSLRSAGDLAGAEAVLRDVLAGRTRALGADHPAVGESHLNLATVLQRQSRFAEALATASRGLAVLDRAYPDGHPSVAIAHMTVGRARLGQGAAAAALADFDRAMALRIRVFGEAHLQTAEARVARARALLALGRSAEARSAVETAIAHLDAGGHQDSVTAREARSLLAEIARTRGTDGYDGYGQVRTGTTGTTGTDRYGRVRQVRTGTDGYDGYDRYVG